MGVEGLIILLLAILCVILGVALINQHYKYKLVFSCDDLKEAGNWGTHRGLVAAREIVDAYNRKYGTSLVYQEMYNDITKKIVEVREQLHNKAKVELILSRIVKTE